MRKEAAATLSILGEPQWQIMLKEDERERFIRDTNEPPWLPHILRRIVKIENVKILPLLIEKFKLIFLSEWGRSGDDQGPQVIEALAFLGEPAKVAIKKLLNETKIDNQLDNQYFIEAVNQALKEIDNKMNLRRTLRDHYPEYLK